MWRDCVKGSVARWLALAGCVGIITSAAACGSGSEPSAPSTSSTSAASVIITPSTMNLAVGARLPLQAQVQDASGQPVRDATIFWSSSDTTIASVSSAGVVSAKTVGAVQIAASVGLKSAVATLEVVPVPVASVAILPANGTIPVGATLALSAVTYDTVGAVLTGRQVLWATSAPQIAMIDARGIVTGVTQGTATITATSEGRTGASTITITAAGTIPPTTPPPTTPPVSPAPPAVATVALSLNSASISIGQTTQANTTLKDAQGNLLSGRTITYSSSSTSVATVSGSGLVTAVAPGTSIIAATSEGKSGTALVTVPAPQPPPPPAVGSVTVSPSSGSIVVGGTLTLAATTKDGSGATLSGRTVVWSSSAPQIASVGSSSGVVTALAAGNATITATSEGKMGNAQITVTVPAVATVSVSPSTGTLQIGGTIALSATPRDASGAVLSGRAITWSSDLPQVATVDATSGVVTGVGGGRATITATSEGKTGSAPITVQAPAPVARIVVTPAIATAYKNSSLVLTADVFDAGGNALTGRTITWTSSTNSVAMVTSTGRTATVTTKNKTGSSTITAASEGKQATSIVFVIE